MNESPHTQPDIQVRCSSGSFSKQNLVAREMFLWAVVTGFRGAIADGAQVTSLLLWGIQRGGALPGTDRDTFFHGILNG